MPRPAKGDKFGRWVVSSEDISVGRQVSVKCTCDCGTVAYKEIYALITGKSRGCRKCSRNDRVDTQVKEMIGRRFADWTVIRKDDSSHRNDWLICRCRCGFEKRVWRRGILTGSTRSCKACAGEKSPWGPQHYNWRGVGEISAAYWASLRNGAEARGIEFLVSIDDAWNKFVEQNRKCALSGIPIQFRGSKRSKKKTASLDRIDSARGYSNDNIQWVHKEINRMKGALPDAEFIKYCHAVSGRNGIVEA